jgi:hypothetical protein
MRPDMVKRSENYDESYQEVDSQMVGECGELISERMSMHTTEELLDICSAITELDHGLYFHGDEYTGQMIAACAQLTMLTYICMKENDGKFEI